MWQWDNLDNLQTLSESMRQASIAVFMVVMMILFVAFGMLFNMIFSLNMVIPPMSSLNSVHVY